MTAQEAISKIYAPKGITSLIAGAISGDFSTLPHQKGLKADLETAKGEVEKTKLELKNCHSDWAYWSILGDLAYWKTIVNILEAAIINNGIVADIEPPKDGGLVMDAIYDLQRWGERILTETKKIVAARAEGMRKI